VEGREARENTNEKVQLVKKKLPPSIKPKKK
jgi:hypothetical protein